MHLAHRAGERAAIIVVTQTELAVAVRALAVRSPIFFPQQLQRHAFALQFLVDQRVVGLRIAIARRRFHVQQRLQCVFIQFRWQRPR